MSKIILLVCVISAICLLANACVMPINVPEDLRGFISEAAWSALKQRQTQQIATDGGCTNRRTDLGVCSFLVDARKRYIGVCEYIRDSPACTSTGGQVQVIEFDDVTCRTQLPPQSPGDLAQLPPRRILSQPEFVEERDHAMKNNRLETGIPCTFVRTVKITVDGFCEKLPNNAYACRSDRDHIAFFDDECDYLRDYDVSYPSP